MVANMRFYLGHVHKPMMSQLPDIVEGTNQKRRKCLVEKDESPLPRMGGPAD